MKADKDLFLICCEVQSEDCDSCNNRATLTTIKITFYQLAPRRIVCRQRENIHQLPVRKDQRAWRRHPVGRHLQDSGESKPVPIFSSSGERHKSNEDNRTKGGKKRITSQLREQTVFRILNDTWKEKQVRERLDNHKT